MNKNSMEIMRKTLTILVAAIVVYTAILSMASAEEIAEVSVNLCPVR